MTVQSESRNPALNARGSVIDQFTALHAVFWVAIAAGIAWYFGAQLDGYDLLVLVIAALVASFLGWKFPEMRVFLPLTAGLALFAIYLYGDSLQNGSQRFLLSYFLASQRCVLWMSLLFGFATLCYWAALWRSEGFAGKLARGFTWCAAGAGFLSLLVRWREGYLIGADVGHIPVSNLYEVFVLFCVITALLHLYFERRERLVGAFVLPAIDLAVGFLIWYSLERGAHEIQPLIPALQSWWMKIHVPANFIGYGAFTFAAMLGLAWLTEPKLRGRIPSREALDDLMYRAITIGFLFFTVATVLGALWAADAWGSYWSWDPKETWALIVWFNYAAWLHLRLVKGWRGSFLAWWAAIGFMITLFAFLGVNMFLSGLHSYGGL